MLVEMDAKACRNRNNVTQDSGKDIPLTNWALVEKSKHSENSQTTSSDYQQNLSLEFENYDSSEQFVRSKM
jgi:hypothetical protein